MEELKLLIEITNKYGLSGLVVLIMVWDKVIRPKWKKHNGTYVSYAELQRRIGVLESNIVMQGVKLDTHLSTLAKHLEKEVEEDVRFAELRNDHLNLKATMELENRHLFNQIGSIFLRLEDQSKDIKEILTLMIEKK